MHTTRMRCWSRLSAGAGLLLVAACGGDRTTRPQPVEEITLETSTMTLTEIGQTGRVRVTAGAQSTTSPTLRVIAESRWLDDVSVLNPAALASSLIEATGPGTVRLEVSAFGLPPREMSVTVAPTAPYVHGARIVASGINVRGYRLSEVAEGSLAWNGAPVPLVSRDSANLIVRAPVRADGQCAETVEATLTMTAGSATLSAAVRIEGSGEVALSVGQYRRLSATEAMCLKLAPVAGAEYAVAFVDLRAIRRAQADGREHEVWSAGFDVTGTRLAAAGSGASQVVRLGVAPEDASRNAWEGHFELGQTSGTSQTLLAARTTPWRVGEKFTHAPTGYAAPDTGEVVKIYGNRYVLAVMKDSRELLTSEWMAEFDKSMDFMLQHGAPLYRRALGVQDPETNEGIGQLVFVAARIKGAWAYAWERVVTLKVDERNVTIPAGRYIVSHEVAHAYQWRLRRETQCGVRGSCGFATILWASEGGADFLANEAHRAAYGYSFDGNHPRNPSMNPFKFVWEAFNTSPHFVTGYSNSANFFRHLTHQLMRGGLSYDAAVRVAMLGSLEGWDRFDAAGHPVKGLTARVREHLGPEWTPEDAMLLWTLAIWADDWTGAPELQEPSVLYASGAPGTMTRKAYRPLSAGTLDGATAATFQRSLAVAGSHGLFEILDNGVGGSYSFSATTPEIAWMIARLR